MKCVLGILGYPYLHLSPKVWVRVIDIRVQAKNKELIIKYGAGGGGGGGVVEKVRC